MLNQDELANEAQETADVMGSSNGDVDLIDDTDASNIVATSDVSVHDKDEPVTTFFSRVASLHNLECFTMHDHLVSCRCFSLILAK